MPPPGRAQRARPAFVRVDWRETGRSHLSLRRERVTAHELDSAVVGLLRSALESRGHATDDDNRRPRVGQPAERAKRVITSRWRHQTSQSLGRCQRELVDDELAKAGILPGEMDDQVQIAGGDECS